MKLNIKSYLRSAVFLLSLLSVTTAYTTEKTDSNSVLDNLSTATWVAEGNGVKIVYIFFDPNCPSCQSLYKSLRSFVNSKQYQFRWLPVAIVNPTSLGKAAAILEAKHPLVALKKNEEHYKDYSGGLEEHLASAETEKQLAANEVLLNMLNIPVIPSMLFYDKEGKAILIQGALSPIALRKVFARLP